MRRPCPTLHAAPRRAGGLDIAAKRPITKWNVLALAVLVFGTIATLGLSHVWIMHWSRTGQAFSLGDWHRIELEAVPTLAYYESPHSVPEQQLDCSITLKDPYGDPMPKMIPTEDSSFRVMLTGWSGRALWEFDLVEPGEYEFRCVRQNVRSDEDVPTEDRIVFLKEPQDLAAVHGRQKLIKIVGGAITVAIATLLYVFHGLALRRAG